MTVLTILIILAALATIVTLIMGIGSMASSGEFDRKHSTQLMSLRVGLQGLTLLLLLIALYFSAV